MHLTEVASLAIRGAVGKRLLYKARKEQTPNGYRKTGPE
jgi:hypothetical protein